MIALLFLLVASATALPNSRIHNGQDATSGDYPHQASLRTVGGSHFCGGVVIGTRWILTAAHCVDGSSPSSFIVRINDHRLNHHDQGQLDYEVSEVRMHGSYGSGSGTFPNDIALLRVSSAISSDNVIGLVSENNDFTGDTCTITGWGLTESGNTLPNVLQTATLTVLSKSNCQTLWNPINGATINDGHICIQDGNKASCNGDSGGPMVIDGRLAGVTSWGINGCGKYHNYQYPSVYTRVSHFLGWIEQISGITP